MSASDPPATTFPPVIHDGVAYSRGSAGSLILCCPKCGRDRFRDPIDYWHRDPTWEKCFTCETVMEPIRMDEIETKWRPIWEAEDNAN